MVATREGSVQYFADTRASEFSHLAGWLYLAKNNRRIAISRIIILGFHFKRIRLSNIIAFYSSKIIIEAFYSSKIIIEAFYSSKIIIEAFYSSKIIRNIS
jgi:hypothetical protein